MKKIIFAFLLTSTMAHAGGSDIGSGGLTSSFSPSFSMMKNIIDFAADDIVNLQNDTQNMAQAYDQLGFFALASKARLVQQNCAGIEAHTQTVAIAIVSLESVPKYPGDDKLEIDDQVGATFTNSFKSYLNYMKLAKDHCGNPGRSLTDIRAARFQIEQASRAMAKVKNEL